MNRRRPGATARKTRFRAIGGMAAGFALALAAAGDGQERPDTPADGRNWTSPATGMEFVWIPAMNMWVGKYEVTNGEYRRKEPRHNSRTFRGHRLDGDRQPVVQVNFDDAAAYAEWLTRQDAAVLGGARYRLPSDREWTTFARCGDDRVYPWGNDWPPPDGRAGNYADETARRRLNIPGIDGYTDGHTVSAPVDRLWANPWGLHGVGGNVWEACVHNHIPNTFGMWRGASWGVSHPGNLRVSAGYAHDGGSRTEQNGFRLVLSREPGPARE